jgi:tape measure domain-containing protein
VPTPLSLVFELIGKDRASDTFKKVGDAADKTAASTERAQKHTESFGHHVGPIMREIARGAGIVSTAALGVGATMAKMGVQSAASMEQTKVSFASLLGSTKAATDQIAKLQKFAAKTPFEQKDVFGYAQQYYALAKSVGLSQKAVIPFLTTVGNLGAVTGASTENIHNAVLAIAQIGSVGKVQLGNLNQIANAFPGFNAAAAIANATGKTTAQVMQEMSKGELSAAQGIPALLKGMRDYKGAAGAMAKQSETLNGLLSTFSDTVKISLTNAFAPLIPVVKKTLSQMTPVIGSALNEVAPVISQFAATLAPILKPLVQGLASDLTAVFQTLGPVLKQLAPLITPLAYAFQSVVEAASPLLQLAAKLLRVVGAPLIDMFSHIVQAITPVVEELARALQPVLPIIAKALTQVMKALEPLLNALAGAFMQILKALAPSLPTIARAFGQVAVAIAQVLTSLTPLIQPLTKIAVELLNKVFVQILLDLARAFVQIMRAVEPLIPPMVQLLNLALKPILWIIGKLGEGIKLLGRAFQAEIGVIGDAVRTVSGWISGIVGDAQNALNVLGRLAGNGPALGGGGISGISSFGGAGSGGHVIARADGGGLPNGWAVVGERGAELIHKVGGSAHVFSNEQSRAIVGATGMRVPGFAGGTGGNLRMIAQFLASKGLDRAHIAAILGNLKTESGFSPTAYNAAEGAIGIAQWEGSRRTALRAFAARHGASETNLPVQLAFMWRELRQRGQLGGFVHTHGVNRAAQFWQSQFEVSDPSSLGDRQANARALFGMLGSGAITATGGASGAVSVAADRARQARKDAVQALRDQLHALNLAGGKDLRQFGRAITGTVADARQAFRQLYTDLKAGGAPDKLLEHLRGVNRRLDAHILERNRLAAKLANVVQRDKQLRGSVSGAITGFFDVTQAGTNPVTGQVTAGSEFAQQKQALVQIRRFSADIRKLENRGLNHAYLRQLATAGPSVLPQLDALLQMPAGMFRRFNRQEAEIVGVGTRTGDFLGRSFYGAREHDLRHRERLQEHDVKRLAHELAHILRHGIHVTAEIDGRQANRKLDQARRKLNDLHGTMA